MVQRNSQYIAFSYCLNPVLPALRAWLVCTWHRQSSLCKPSIGFVFSRCWFPLGFLQALIEGKPLHQLEGTLFGLCDTWRFLNKLVGKMDKNAQMRDCVLLDCEGCCVVKKHWNGVYIFLVIFTYRIALIFYCLFMIVMIIIIFLIFILNYFNFQFNFW